jgi:hypothetical protein
MVGKKENAAKTLVRIEAIILQGVFMGLLLLAMSIVIVPAVPFAVGFNRWVVAAPHTHFLTRFLMMPLWMLSGCLLAVMMPIRIVARTLDDIKNIAAMEWAMRKLPDEAKKPNGHPLKMPSIDERRARDIAQTIGVIKDYNGEARMHGQGLPIDETRL